MVSKILHTTHKISEKNGFGITQPAAVGSVLSVGNNPHEESELEKQESEVLRTAPLK
jgi:hypothetical protein